MKKLLEQGNSGTKRQPHVNRSFEWIQESYTEAIESILESIIPDTDGLYIKLYGLELTSNGINTAVTAGAIYYDGIVYQVPAFSTDIGTIYTDVFFTITTSYDAVDPITFTDGTTSSVHENKQMVVQLAESGSDVALSELVDLRKQLEMVDVAVSTFKVYNSTAAAWEVGQPRSFAAGTTIQAHKIGKKITLVFKLIMNFNNIVANRIDFSCTSIGFDLPTWLQPENSGAIDRVIRWSNSEATTYNTIDQAYCRINTGDVTANAPDFRINTGGIVLNGGATKGLATRFSGLPFNFDYTTDASGTQLVATTDDFIVTAYGEITYEAANYDLG